MGNGMMDGMMGTPMMIMGFIFMLLVVAVLVAGLVWLVRALGRDGDGRSRPERSAIEQLESRYARGEIERDEYLQRRNDLEGS